MKKRPTGYWHRLLSAIAGRDGDFIEGYGETKGAKGTVDTGETRELFDGRSEQVARIATLEMDLHERDEQVKSMRLEYDTLRLSKDRIGNEAGQNHLGILFKKLVGPLSNLEVLATAVDNRDDVLAADLVQLFRDMQKKLYAAGLEPIGGVGKHAKFSAADHQWISGGHAHRDIEITVLIPGYRFGNKVLQKAMVSIQEK